MSFAVEDSMVGSMAAEPDPEALGPSTGIAGWVVRTCSLPVPPLMKNDDGIWME